LPPSALPGQQERTLAFTFTLVTIVCWVLAAFGGGVDLAEYVGSVLLLGLVVVLVFVRHVRVGGHELLDLPWSLAYLAATALLRAASPGESALALIPVVCIALTGTGWGQLTVVMVATALACVIPVAVVGPSDFAALRGPLVAIALAIGIGITTRLLVSSARRQAAVAEGERQALQRVAEVVYTLFESPDVRSDLCSASLQVGRAAMAVLFEPTPDGEIRVTAQAGADPALVGLTLGPGESLARLLKEGRRRLQNDIVAEQWDSPRASQIWELGGRPDAILYQPLLRGTEPVGVLCVGWYDVVVLSGPRVTAIGLLTHEAALLLTRADQVTRLTGMVTTDPLTGLQNRRAWESRIAQMAMQPGPVTIAMIDLDNFKAFNDTHGHIAGDALLRETADAWIGQLRGADLLARLGGEEFGLLLYEAELESGYEIAERLRMCVTHGQTCCVGLAQRRSGETIESVVRRADQALYDAKAAGRDLARAAL
jgi:diguanylate cyclase (GGDEF)-like protein